MNSSLKQKIEEAAERRSVDADACCECEAEESFKAGAQFLLDAGVRFSDEDMAEFAEWYSMNWDIDFKPDAALEQWLEERRKTNDKA